MLINDIITKKVIMCDYLDHKDYTKTLVVHYTESPNERRCKVYNCNEFEEVEDEEHYMYITDKYLFVCKQENKEWCK